MACGDGHPFAPFHLEFPVTNVYFPYFHLTHGRSLTLTNSVQLVPGSLLDESEFFGGLAPDSEVLECVLRGEEELDVFAFLERVSEVQVRRGKKDKSDKEEAVNGNKFHAQADLYP